MAGRAHLASALRDAADRPGWLLGACALAILLAVVIRLGFAYASWQYLPVTSDEASSVLLAKFISRGELPLLFLGQPYQFPIESYLRSLFIDWTPRNVVGTRSLSLVLGMLSVAGFWLLALRLFAPGRRWPALLLVLLPSTYLVMLQAAYAPPQYPANATFAWLILLLAARVQPRTGGGVPLALIGLLCGLAFSNHMLMTPLLAAVLLVVVAGGGFGSALRRLPWIGGGLLVGLVPDFLVLWFEPESHDHLEVAVPWTAALERLWSGNLFTMTLPRALGADPPLFPDFPETLGGSDALRIAVSITYMALLAGVTVARVVAVVGQWRRHRQLRLEPIDIFPLASLATLLAFLIGARSHYEAYRFLVISVWCLPFLVGYAFSAGGRRLRALVGGLTVMAATFNAGTAFAVMDRWADPSFARLVADTPGLQGLVAELDRMGVRSCYASFWLAYRITFHTDERIVCSMPYNERFPGWPIPYKSQVDRDPGAVYVLTQTFGARVTALAFMQELKRNEIASRQTWVRPFIIFSDFAHDRSAGGRFLRADEFTIEIEDQNGVHEHRALTDEDAGTGIHFRSGDELADALVIRLHQPRALQRVTIHYDRESAEDLPHLNVEVQDGEGWVPVASDVPGELDRVTIIDGRPIYLGWHQTIWFESTAVRALRISVASFDPDAPWMPSGIDIGILQR